MVTTPKFELIQERLGRPLDRVIDEWRAAGVSAPAMARLLAAETRVVVSSETIRNWLRALTDAA
jgi:hypothetical protein